MLAYDEKFTMIVRFNEMKCQLKFESIQSYGWLDIVARCYVLGLYRGLRYGEDTSDEGQKFPYLLCTNMDNQKITFSSIYLAYFDNYIKTDILTTIKDMSSKICLHSLLLQPASIPR